MKTKKRIQAVKALVLRHPVYDKYFTGFRQTKYGLSVLTTVDPLHAKDFGDGEFVDLFLRILSKRRRDALRSEGLNTVVFLNIIIQPGSHYEVDHIPSIGE
jgi:hypothetical protein